MLLVEIILVLQEFTLPSWFLPSNTPYDCVANLHRIFPSYMNACRCVSGAYFVDRKANAVQSLGMIGNRMLEISTRLGAADKMVDGIAARFQREELRKREADSLTSNGEESLPGADDAPIDSYPRDVGAMAKALTGIRKQVSLSKEGRTGAFSQFMEGRMKVMADPALLAKYTTKEGDDSSPWTTLLYWALYLAVWYCYSKAQPGDRSAQ